jgi:diguanylate cyclase (GGDEF)-like protein
LINTPGLDADYYFSGFLLLEIFCFTLIRLRFWYALTCAIIMYIAIISVYSILTGKVYELLINQSFFLFSVSAMSLTANYFMELSSRKDFLQSQLIQLRNIWLENSNQQLHQISKTDPLTGIANRRFFNQHLKKEWQRSSRLSLPVSLLMLDVDFFKAYNDIYGHLAGDRCLVSIAKLLAKFAQRPGDLVARYGGEEFVIVLASTPEQGGRYIAEKIMQAIHQLNLPNKGSKISNRVTVSIGLVSQVPSDNKKSKINNFIHQADQALYEAKKAGRSQLKVSCEELFLRENEINQAAEVKPDQKETSSTVDQSPAR